MNLTYYSLPGDHGGLGMLLLSFQLLCEGGHLLPVLTPCIKCENKRKIFELNFEVHYFTTKLELPPLDNLQVLEDLLTKAKDLRAILAL